MKMNAASVVLPLAIVALASASRGASTKPHRRRRPGISAGCVNARLVVIEQSAPMPMLEETERYLAALGAFLREAEGGK